VGIKEYIEVIIAIIIIMAITVIGTTAITEVVTSITEAAGVVVDQVALLVIRLARIITAIETTAKVVLLVGIQKVLFFVMAISLFVIQALLLVFLEQLVAGAGVLYFSLPIAI
jgi:hypothetical protein